MYVGSVGFPAVKIVDKKTHSMPGTQSLASARHRQWQHRSPSSLHFGESLARRRRTSRTEKFLGVARRAWAESFLKCKRSFGIDDGRGPHLVRNQRLRGRRAGSRSRCSWRRETCVPLTNTSTSVVTWSCANVS